MDRKVYLYSTKLLEEKKKLFMLIRIIIPFLLIGFLFFDPQQSQSPLQVKIIAFLFSLVLIEAILFIQPKIMLKKMSEKKVYIGKTNIEIIDGKYTQEIPYKDINKVQIVYDQTNIICGLKLYYGRKKTFINYIDKPAEFLEDIKSVISEKTTMVNKSINTIWQKPIMLVSIMILTCLIIVCFKKAGGQFTFTYNVFNAFITTTLGIIFLTFKPISKQLGKRFMKFETILSFLMLGSGICMLLFLLI